MARVAWGLILARHGHACCTVRDLPQIGTSQTVGSHPGRPSLFSKHAIPDLFRDPMLQVVSQREQRVSFTTVYPDQKGRPAG